MSDLFPNQGFDIPVERHTGLPLLSTYEFDFFRVVGFNESFYGKTVSNLHKGNLRLSRTDNRYSCLFPGQKLSYWADSIKTAKAEYFHWNKCKNFLTFWAYDDGSSFTPTFYPAQKLTIIDGFQLEFNKILCKIENNEKLSISEKDMVNAIAIREPDCLAYQSERNPDGVNFLFFEHGFKKLSLKEVSINLNDLKSRNHNRIVCATSCDYTPILKSYGEMFLPIARIGKDDDYVSSEEYTLRLDVISYNIKDMKERIEERHDNN